MAGNLKFSSSVVDIEPRDGLWTTLRKDRLGMLASLEWTVVGTLALLVVLGFVLIVLGIAVDTRYDLI